MSISRPTSNNPNPSTRWFEWKGSTGKLVWYDKETQKNIEVTGDFLFLVLDQLETVVGYNNKHGSIRANEIRDTRQDTFVVKWQKTGEILAEGLWRQIKDRVNVNRGSFAKSCYIAYRDGGELRLGNIKFSGCSLGPWIDFMKNHRGDIDRVKAVLLRADAPDTTGSVRFTPPKFEVKESTEDTRNAAIKLDEALQQYLDGYLKKTRVEQVNQTIPHAPEDENQDRPPDDYLPQDTTDHSDLPSDSEIVF